VNDNKAGNIFLGIPASYPWRLASRPWKWLFWSYQK